MFKLTQEEIEEMDKMIQNFEDDPRKPFLCGTEKNIRDVEFNGIKYGIKFSIESVDDDEMEDE